MAGFAPPLPLEARPLAILLELLQRVFASVGAFLVHPEGLVLLAVTTALVTLQYRRVAALEQELYGLPRNRPWPLAADALVNGVVAGIGVSILAAVLGIGLVQPPGEPMMLSLLWLLALGLSLIHPRLICFAYGTSLLSLSYLLLGWPRVDVPGLTGLVAVMHLAEALLIALSGDRCATPLTFGRPGQKPVPGFQLQRFWPVLLVLPVGLPLPESLAGPDTVELWPWWPLVRPDPALVEPGFYVLLPVVAIMGYGDLAIANSPREQATRSALWLAAYSLTLLGLSVAASHLPFARWLAAVFSAAGHEAVLWLGIRTQLRGRPWLRRTPRGVVVLDALPGTPAAQAGLRPGSVILEVSGQPVSSREELHTAIQEAPAYMEIVFKHDQQLQSRRVPRPEGGLLGFGVILVPEPGDRPMAVIGPDLWRGWAGRLFRRWRRSRRDAA